MTYPDPHWDKETRMDFYGRFLEFADAVRLCGYRFVHHDEEGMFNKSLSVATDVIPIEQIGFINDYEISICK